MSAPMEFERVAMADGTERVDLMRLTDGRVACCICFEFVQRTELEPVAGEPGRVWDICQNCAVHECLT